MVNNTAVQLDAAFSALGDPTRRAIVERLARGGSSVGELARPFAMSLPAVSKHLRVLERAGLLAREKRGRVHHCRLQAQGLRDVARWLDRYRAFWVERLDALDRYLDETGRAQPEEQTWRAPHEKRRGSRSAASTPPARSGSSRPGRSRKR